MGNNKLYAKFKTKILNSNYNNKNSKKNKIMKKTLIIFAAIVMVAGFANKAMAQDQLQ